MTPDNDFNATRNRRIVLLFLPVLPAFAPAPTGGRPSSNVHCPQTHRGFYAIRVRHFTLAVPVTKQHYLAAHFRRNVAQGGDVAFLHRQNQVIFPAQTREILPCAVIFQRQIVGARHARRRSDGRLADQRA